MIPKLNPKITGIIGFAARSGKLLLGKYSVEQGIKSKKAKIVLASEDMSAKRREVLRLWCTDMDIPFLTLGSKEEYGALLKKPPLGLMALTDANMVLGIIAAAKTNGGD